MSWGRIGKRYYPNEPIAPSGKLFTETSSKVSYNDPKDVKLSSTLSSTTNSQYRIRMDLPDGAGHREEVEGTWTAPVQPTQFKHNTTYSEFHKEGKNGYEYQGPPLYGRGEGRHWRPQAVDTGRPFHTATSYNADMGEKAISRAVTASPFKINTRDLTSRSFGYVNDKFTEVVDSTPVDFSKLVDGRPRTTNGSTWVQKPIDNKLYRETRLRGATDAVLKRRYNPVPDGKKHMAATLSSTWSSTQKNDYIDRSTDLPNMDATLDAQVRVMRTDLKYPGQVRYTKGATPDGQLYMTNTSKKPLPSWR